MIENDKLQSSDIIATTLLKIFGIDCKKVTTATILLRSGEPISICVEYLRENDDMVNEEENLDEIAVALKEYVVTEKKLINPNFIVN